MIRNRASLGMIDGCGGGNFGGRAATFTNRDQENKL